MSGMNQNKLDIEVVRALADEVRLEILMMLGHGEMNVNEIADRSKVSRPTVSHHLQIMKRSGILVSRKEGKEIYYSVDVYVLTSTAESLLKFVSFGSFE